MSCFTRAPHRYRFQVKMTILTSVVGNVVRKTNKQTNRSFSKTTAENLILFYFFGFADGSSGYAVMSREDLEPWLNYLYRFCGVYIFVIWKVIEFIHVTYFPCVSEEAVYTDWTINTSTKHAVCVIPSKMRLLY